MPSFCGMTTRPWLWVTIGTGWLPARFETGNGSNPGNSPVPTGGSVVSGLAQLSVGSTGMKCGPVTSLRQWTIVGMPRTFSNTGPGTVRANSVAVDPGILTWPPYAMTVVAGKPGGSICAVLCRTFTVYSLRM